MVNLFVCQSVSRLDAQVLFRSVWFQILMTLNIKTTSFGNLGNGTKISEKAATCLALEDGGRRLSSNSN